MLHRHALILSRGDPGLFDVFKRLGRGALAFATGGPFAAGRAVLAPSRGARASVSEFPSIRSIQRPSGGALPLQRVAGVRGIAQRLAPGGATGFETPIPVTGGCPSGYHPNKSSYSTKAGFVEKASKCVRNRRRNLSNGRANARALRRMAAWDKQERKRSTVLRKIARR